MSTSAAPQATTPETPQRRRKAPFPRRLPLRLRLPPRLRLRPVRSPRPNRPTRTSPASGPTAGATAWRGRDKDFRKQLERHDSPESVARAWREAQKKISQGIKPPTLKPDATPEDIAAFREAAGIPAEFDRLQAGSPEWDGFRGSG